MTAAPRVHEDVLEGLFLASAFVPSYASLRTDTFGVTDMEELN